MNGWLQAMMITAFSAGMLGGAHCAAMCGGIVGMSCRAAPGDARRWGYLLAYNAGRMSSYVVAGMLAGAIGQGGVQLRGGVLAQHLTMFFMGVTLLVVALNMAGVRPVTESIESAGSLLWRRLQPLARHVLPVQSPVQALGLGMLWGWLPCGMVYAMLLTALASGNATEGGLIMAAFALGTLPNLLLIGAAWSSFLRWMSVGWVRRLASAAVAIVGLYGILHVLQPSALDPDSLLCRSWPGLAEWLRP